jgi:hypothetical protein
MTDILDANLVDPAAVRGMAMIDRRLGNPSLCWVWSRIPTWSRWPTRRGPGWNGWPKLWAASASRSPAKVSRSSGIVRRIGPCKEEEG